ncbi:max-binding protein MNT isoform X3 [Phalacrocorax aristotelis]|uniref:max-binding protein MNT isoform X3 n=1 Tax=Phalacrocorax aristotelis TaxID=126867 RepID=UPI003F4B39C0
MCILKKLFYFIDLRVFGDTHPPEVGKARQTCHPRLRCTWASTPAPRWLRHPPHPPRRTAPSPRPAVAGRAVAGRLLAAALRDSAPRRCSEGCAPGGNLLRKANFGEPLLPGTPGRRPGAGCGQAGVCGAGGSGTGPAAWPGSAAHPAEENEKHEKLRLEREQEQKAAGKASVPRANSAIPPEEPRSELLVPISPPAPAPPPPPPLAAPISVIPIPVVTSPPQQAAQTTLSPPLVQRHQPLVSTPSVTKEASSVAPVIQRPPGPLLPDGKAATPPSGSPKQLQHYAAPVLAISQHHVVQQPIQPQPHQPLQHPGAPPQLGALKLAPAEDTKPNEQKKRPGGVGTREVHNKLEKNRRAHLKECFETLKRNIPNVDDKKTSNLSVLRSALRYIQTLKRKEKEYEHEMERLAREKIATQQRLAELKNELSQWMDILEIDRIIRQTVQPEDDQASTSTASEGEDNMDEDMEDDRPVNSLPKLTQRQHPELLKAVPSNAASHHPAVLPQHLSIQQKQTPAHAQPPIQTQALVQPQAIVPAQTHIVAASTVQSTVIAHTATTHASVIQTVNHVIQGPQTKHIAHIAPSTSSPVQLTTAAQPIGHITVHPATINHMAHLGPQLPIYPQPVAVSQPVVSHIAHTISHQQVNGTTNLGQQAVMAKPAVGTQVVHHPQLVGQTVLNPVTMVTMPSFPVSTLKLA